MTLLESPMINFTGNDVGWHVVCALSKLTPDRGVCALIEGRQVAIFRTSFNELFAVSNTDPVSGASVMSRGIVGSTGGRPTVSSPMYKQRYDLESGACVDDPAFALSVFAVRETGGVVEVLLS